VQGHPGPNILYIFGTTPSVKILRTRSPQVGQAHNEEEEAGDGHR
jgi:hypothetical protein